MRFGLRAHQLKAIALVKRRYLRRHGHVGQDAVERATVEQRSAQDRTISARPEAALDAVRLVNDLGARGTGGGLLLWDGRGG